MSISELGSLGEFISSIAVVASLIYVSFQIRQNTRQLRRSEYNAAMNDAAALRRVISDESNANLLAKAASITNSLSEADYLRLDAFCNDFFWLTFNNWDRVKVGVLDPYFDSNEYRSQSWSFMNDERYTKWWANNQLRFPPEFVREVNKFIESSGS